MATKTETTYICDGCTKEVEKASDLRRFVLAERTLDNKIVIEGAKTELCVSCEKRLHEALRPLMTEVEFEKIEGYVRG